MVIYILNIVQIKVEKSKRFSYKAFLGDRCDINGPIVCAEGSCYSQNFWFAQCLNRCPEGWACQSKL